MGFIFKLDTDQSTCLWVKKKIPGVTHGNPGVTHGNTCVTHGNIGVTHGNTGVTHLNTGVTHHNTHVFLFANQVVEEGIFSNDHSTGAPQVP